MERQLFAGSTPLPSPFPNHIKPLTLTQSKKVELTLAPAEGQG